MKATIAHVYALSRTLDLLVFADGSAWFQRNEREPLRLSASEMKNLQELARPGMMISTEPPRRGAVKTVGYCGECGVEAMSLNGQPVTLVHAADCPTLR